MQHESTLVAGRFQLGRSIGGGATGNVYAGQDTRTGEPVAVKVLHSELVASMPELVERFRREAEALRRLNHPNIVKVLETVEENGQHYIVMEYVGGGSLAALLKRRPQLPVAQVVAIGLELSDALSRAHYLEILHRDIKPANILLADDGTPRLTDFGLARLSNHPAVTPFSSVLGTLQYLAPEVYETQKLDEGADLWSFGIVLFEMLAGSVPFADESTYDLIWAIKNRPLPDLDYYRKDVPPALVRLIGRMLEKDRPVRIASARQAGAELEGIQRAAKGQAQVATSAPKAIREASPAQAQAPRIRVLIVDDHAVVRQGLRTFIALQPDMQVVGEGTNGAEAIELARTLLPDIVLLDLVMPQMDGVQATGRILECSPKSRILILTSFGEDDKVFPAIRAGAQGYLLKDIQPNELVQAVREAHQGKTQLHPDIARKLLSAVARSNPSDPKPAEKPAEEAGLSELTGREREVLQLIAQGLNNRDIAEKMIISEKTVKSHVSSILGKLNLEDRTQAAVWALKHGLS